MQNNFEDMAPAVQSILENESRAATNRTVNAAILWPAVFALPALVAATLVKQYSGENHTLDYLALNLLSGCVTYFTCTIPAIGAYGILRTIRRVRTLTENPPPKSL